MFKKLINTAKIPFSNYYILTLVVMFLLLIGIFFAFNAREENAYSEEEIVQFNFSINGKHYIIPSPFHSFDYLNIMGFSWVKLVEVKNTSDYPNESQIALNLGMRAADGIILLFANQKDEARQTRTTVLELSEKLGIIPDIREAITFIDQAVITNADKSILSDRLLFLEYQIEKSLHKKKKDNLAVLVELGGWLEGLHIVSKGISENYNPIYAEILRQPHIAEIYIEVITSLSNRSDNENEKQLLQGIVVHLEQIYNLTNHSLKEAFPLTKVKELHSNSAILKKLIESK